MWNRRLTLTLCALGLALPASAKPPASWAYQLQGYQRDALLGVAVDLLVVDIDELASARVTAADLKRRNGHVVSYLSIGEAERYRGYWKPGWSEHPPEWLDAENPEWAGNYKVRYWHPEWRAITMQAVRRIAAAGFDGVYLDVVDAYEHYQARGVTDARASMVRLVKDLAAAGRSVRPDFMVIAQNAAELTRSSAYLAVLSGLAKEDTWYDGDYEKPPSEVRYDLGELARVRNAGKFVLTIDYPSRSGSVREFCRQARSERFVPFVAPRELDRLPARPGDGCGATAGTLVSR